jgi:IS605 OrfB family transposase
MSEPKKPLRAIARPFVADGPTGVSIRDRLKGLTLVDEEVLRAVGVHLGSWASKDLKTRCAQGLEHSATTWAARKRELTPASSSRWAGAITKATHDQWALSRRGQAAHIQSLQAGIATLTHRLALPIGDKGSKGSPGGYRSNNEWFGKKRRLGVLTDRLARLQADHQAGVVHVVRGSRRLLHTRHHLDHAQLSHAEWRERWESARWFLSADGESGKRYGNETIRITPDGQVSIKLPAPLAHLANASHGRYVLASQVAFAHRGCEWADRVAANRAVAYRIHHDAARGRWYVDASWSLPAMPAIGMDAALAHGVIGVDTNADHLAAWRLDVHGNPVGQPRRFAYDLSGSTSHRDAQVRHALTRLLHWARTCGVTAIAVEDLDFSAQTTREKHGRKRRFRQLIAGMPTGKLRARLASIAEATGIAVIAVDAAYTSQWGGQHWHKPLATAGRTITRHDAASIAIGRRAQGHAIRRRTTPPRHDQSDRGGHRIIQADQRALRREETRRPVTDRAHDARTRTGTHQRTRATSASTTVRDARSSRQWVHDPLQDTV